MNKKLRQKYKVSTKNLRYSCNPEEFKFKTDYSPQGLESLIIRDDAVKSIKTGLSIQDKHHNIFLTGPVGIDKNRILKTIIKEYIESEMPKEKHQRKDIVSVYNFESPDKSAFLEFPAGKGEEFQRDLADVTKSILKTGMKLYKQKLDILKLNYTNQSNILKRIFDEKLKEIDIEGEQIITQMEVIEQERKEKPQERKKHKIVLQKLTNQLNVLDEKDKKASREFQIATLTLNKDNAAQLKKVKTEYQLQIISPEINSLRQKYSDLTDLKNLEKQIKYFDNIESEINKEVKTLISGEDDKLKDNTVIQLGQISLGSGLPSLPNPNNTKKKSAKYKVNLLNKIESGEEQINGIPIIFENKPTQKNLFGKKGSSNNRFVFGGPEQDTTQDAHLKIKAGSLIKANGGYLVINIMDFLVDNSPGIRMLFKDLEKGKTQIGGEPAFSFLSEEETEGEEINLDVKVILTGTNGIYQNLTQISEQGIYEEFRKTFGIKAEMDSVMENTAENRKKYVNHLASLSKEEGLKQITPKGMAEIIRYSTTITGKKEKLTTDIDNVMNVLREANKEAGKNKKITDERVKKAIKSKKERHQLVDEKYKEFVDKDILALNTSGEKIGEINGLAVLGLADISFGKPTRITASKPVRGSNGVTGIHEKVDLSGPFEKMGRNILNMIIRDRYTSPLSEYDVGESVNFECTLAYEQSYSMIDGDSASSTGLYVALSSIGQFPLDQSIALTGRVSQKGEVQAIGGVNDKIEGFYQTCKFKGFTGEQGVMIPKINEKDLTLNDEIMKSIRKGEFTIYSVSNIEEGLEVLTGMPMKEIDKKVSENLKKFIKSNN